MFCDPNFLRRHMAGLLEVTVKSGEGLPAMDVLPLKSSDPYLQLAVGDSTASTRTVMHTLEPKWGETVWLFVK